MSSDHLERVAEVERRRGFTPSLWYALPLGVLTALLLVLVYRYHALITLDNLSAGLTVDFGIFVLIGLFAQLVDGTLGMGYGATCTSFLLSFGIPPATSSLAVHVAEMFTTGASAMSHHRFRNVNKKLALNLIVPGVLGAIVGAYVLADLVDGQTLRPAIALYMIVLASLIVLKGLRPPPPKKRTRNLNALATFGGFMDAIGGGGWGPIVTSTLLARGRDARYTIGSVNTAEFAVALASGCTFVLVDGITGWQVILGLLIGGVAGAPLAAYLVDKLPRRVATVLVGALLIFLSVRTIVASVG